MAKEDKIQFGVWIYPEREGVRFKYLKLRKQDDKFDRTFYIYYEGLIFDEKTNEYKKGKVEEKVGRESQGRSLREAYDLRSQILGNIEEGIGPRSLKEMRDQKHAETEAKEAGENSGITLREAYAEYKDVSTSGARTFYDYDLHMKNTFPDWKDLRLKDITGNMVLKKHSQRGRKAPDQANKSFKFLQAIYKHIIGIDALDPKMPDSDKLKLNPVSILNLKKRWFKKKDKVFLSYEDDVKPIFKAILELEDSPNHPEVIIEEVKGYFFLVLFCGSRKTETLKLRKENVNLERRTLRFPGTDTKNGKPLILPIPDYVFPFFRDRIEAQDGSVYIFPNRTKGSITTNLEHREGVKRHTAQIVESAKTEHPFSLHRLRDVVATISEELGHPELITKAILNHSASKSVTDRYKQPKTVKDLREPMRQIEEEILRLAGNPPNPFKPIRLLRKAG